MAYTLTPARRAALKRAQLASAARRRGKGKGKLAAAHRALGAKGPQGKFAGKKGLAKNVAKVGGFAAAAGGAVYAGHHFKNTVKNQKSNSVRAKARQTVADRAAQRDAITAHKKDPKNHNGIYEAGVVKATRKTRFRIRKARRALKRR